MPVPQWHRHWREVAGRAEELKTRVQLQSLSLPGTELPASPQSRLGFLLSSYIPHQESLECILSLLRLYFWTPLFPATPSIIIRTVAY